MLDKTTRTQIIQLINEQVVPAMGCTEPIAVALCTARAKELLQQRPEKIKVWLSANMLKNAMGVGIPGTGMIGLPIAIALGAIIGKSEYQLEVIKDLTPQALEQGKQFIANPDNICIKLKENITEKLYIEVTCEAEATPPPPSSPAVIRISSTKNAMARCCWTSANKPPLRMKAMLFVSI